MTNHPNRSKHAAIRKHIKAKVDVERVKYVEADDEWHAYGLMPNSTATGWWYVGRTADVAQEMRIERSE